MGVSVQGYTDVCVTHDILQGFRIHPGFCHIRAKGVPAYMRGNFRHLDTVNPVVFLNDMLQILFPVKATIGISFLSRNKNPAYPSTIGSTFDVLRLAMILRKHAATASVIGT